MFETTSASNFLFQDAEQLLRQLEPKGLKGRVKENFLTQERCAKNFLG